MKIAISELELLREEVKNCHRIIKDLQKKREFVGLSDEEIINVMPDDDTPMSLGEAFSVFAELIEAKLKEKNT